MRNLFLCILAIFYSYFLFAQDSTLIPGEHKTLKYGSKGFELADKSGNHLMRVELRLQFRAAYPYNKDFISASTDKETIHLGINRARVKIGGHSFKPWLKYYMEYDVNGSNLLDFRVMYEKYAFLKIKIGQWKVQYNRERIISSGKQQTVDRSLLTHAFTLDRQQGISVFGNLAGSGMANFSYWVSAFMGTGRGGGSNDDSHLMYMGRLQWNPTGKPLGFAGSDIEYHERFKMLIAAAGVTNRSQYTRFSTSGGGQLEGFAPGEDGQYRVNQCMIETAAKFKGFGWQHESHFKQINDYLNNASTDMLGNLFQAGYLINSPLNKQRPKIELYARYSFYYPTYNLNKHMKEEYSVGSNWFVNGHRMKITTEASYLHSNYTSDEVFYGWRYRLQLDISL